MESNAALCPRCGLVYLSGRRYCSRCSSADIATPSFEAAFTLAEPERPPPLLAYGYAVGGYFNLAQRPVRLATPITRLSAFVLDLVVLFSLAVGAATVAGLCGVLHLLILAQVLLLASGAAAYLYLPAFWLAQGRTPGMMALRLRVVSTDGEALTLRASVVRYLGFHACLLTFGVGFLGALWDSNGRCWHDKLARTIVVQV